MELTRDEMQAIRDEAMKAIDPTQPFEARMLMNLACAADALDAHLARLELATIPEEDDEGADNDQPTTPSP